MVFCEFLKIQRPLKGVMKTDYCKWCSRKGGTTVPLMDKRKVSKPLPNSRPLTATPKGDLGICWPAKKTLTECRPSSFGVYSTKKVSLTCGVISGFTASRRPWGSRITQSTLPAPAPVNNKQATDGVPRWEQRKSEVRASERKPEDSKSWRQMPSRVSQLL